MSTATASSKFSTAIVAMTLISGLVFSVGGVGSVAAESMPDESPSGDATSAVLTPRPAAAA